MGLGPAFRRRPGVGWPEDGPWRHWATGTSAPCTALFKPIAVDQPVDLGASLSNIFDPGSVWWRHELLHRATMAAYSTLVPRYQLIRNRVEGRWINDPPLSQEAFDQAGQLEARWFQDVPGARLADTRPFWVRWGWGQTDSAAQMGEELFR